MTQETGVVPGGYAGRFLQVDLSDGTSEAGALNPRDALELIGGYGIGAKHLFLNQPAGVDPLGPDNWLGFTTGPLTGSGAPTGTRWTVVTKSPLTGTWGDANAGGWFGQRLKASGYDAVFFRGVSPHPVYLMINDGEVSLHNAEELWGRDTFDTEERLKAKHGNDVHVACIGPAGERLSLISGIVHARGRVAARSGVGAVMGSKKLKAVVVRGTNPIPLPDPDAARAAKLQYVEQIKNGVGYADFYRTTGTLGAIAGAIKTADAPILNWAGVPSDFPDAESIGAAAMYESGRKKQTCWGCPVACWGEVYLEGESVPQPEYETVAAFGSMQLVDDLQAVLKSNELCNRYGLDTISAGATIAFAMECFDQGLIREKQIGFPLPWGDGKAAVRLVEMMALRQGFGNLLADGSMRAAQQIGGEAESFAIHVGGQELPMHDPRLEPGLGLVYVADATPGRHNQANCFLAPEGLDTSFPGFGQEVGDQVGRGRYMKTLGNLFHALQASGACQFGYLSTTVDFLCTSLHAVTGHPYDQRELLLCGERIANLRQSFNVREGINFLQTKIPWRAYGRPPLSDGPNAGITVKIEGLIREYLDEMDWDLDSAVPSHRKLRELRLDFVIDDLSQR
jgi:aldehyde:ferredoxin oxidoreductase